MWQPHSITPGSCRAFSRDGGQFAVGWNYGEIDLWGLESANYIGVLQEPGNRSLSSSTTASSLTFLDGGRLAAVFNQETLLAFSLPTNVSTTLIPRQSGTAKEGSDIRGLAVSGDGRRLVSAGMRMGTQPGPFSGGTVCDVPMHGEVQVWDSASLKLVATLKGLATEKFSTVALDNTGQRVAAVTTGVAYNPRMGRAMQYSAEYAPQGPRRVYLWDLSSPTSTKK